MVLFTMFKYLIHLEFVTRNLAFFWMAIQLSNDVFRGKTLPHGFEKPFIIPYIPVDC